MLRRLLTSMFIMCTVITLPSDVSVTLKSLFFGQIQDVKNGRICMLMGGVDAYGGRGASVDPPMGAMVEIYSNKFASAYILNIQRTF